MPSANVRQRAYTLIEIVLVIGVLVAISALAVPNFIDDIRRDALPRSGRQLRSLMTLVRANAAFDGKRYRIRFPNEDELDPIGTENQPIIERENDPVKHPEEFAVVNDSWAVDRTLIGKVRCAEVLVGRPTMAKIRQRRERKTNEVEKALLKKEMEQGPQEFDPDRPPVLIEPDGTSDWVTFVLTEASPEVKLEDLDVEEYPQIEMIVEGFTGLAWMQRPFYDSEIDLFEEKGWPAVMRQDFLEARELTENDVLELRESNIQGHRVELKGRELKAADGPAGGKTRVP